MNIEYMQAEPYMKGFKQPFKVVLETTYFSSLQKGELFFDVREFNQTATKAPLMIKLGYKKVMAVYTGVITDLKQRDYVYRVFKDE